MIGVGVSLRNLRNSVSASADPFAALIATLQAGAAQLIAHPLEYGSMFQDRAGTIPVTASGQLVGHVLDAGGGDYHATAISDPARGIFRDVDGKRWIEYNGVNTTYQTEKDHPFTFTGPIDVFSGFQKLGTTKQFETLVSAGTVGNAVLNNNKSMGFLVTTDNSNRIGTDIWEPSGVRGSTVLASGIPSVSYFGVRNWSTHLSSGDTVIRLNGSEETVSPYASENPPSLNAGKIKIGVFDIILASSFFRGNHYQTLGPIMRVGTNATTEQIEAAESYYTAGLPA